MKRRSFIKRIFVGLGSLYLPWGTNAVESVPQMPVFATEMERCLWKLEYQYAQPETIFSRLWFWWNTPFNKWGDTMTIRGRGRLKFPDWRRAVNITENDEWFKTRSNPKV